jgi:dUTPase
MKITISFSDENSAFEDNGIEEYKRIMQQVMMRVCNCETGEYRLQDSNGNTIGEFRIE